MEAHLQNGGRTGVRICRVDEVAEGRGRGFVLGAGHERSALFVIRKTGVLRAYRNQCPHAGTPLDWVPDRFFDPSGAFLICATHGAIFRPEDGACIAGPCRGQGLAALDIRVADGDIMLCVAEMPRAPLR